MKKNPASSDRPAYSFVAATEGLTRRSFIITTSLAGAALWSSHAFGAVGRSPKFSDYPFQLGVASGDPVSDGFVIWTRLAPKPLAGGGMPQDPVAVSWQVSETESMSRIVQRGEVTASPDWAHSVHVEVDGLQPDRWYWYQFKAGHETSPPGRTRTLPAGDSTPERLRFAFASCQRWDQGLYTAFDHMAEEDLDLVVHLGDYIYEAPAKTDVLRPIALETARTLDQYRAYYSLYKMDPSLQRIHAQVPWVVTWDDHETWNNMAGGSDRSPEQLARRAAAYQAYYEHMPLRRTSLPRGPDMQLYRRLAFGSLAEFFVLDSRQYRTKQPPGPKYQPHSARSLDPKATILGTEQRDWLLKGLSGSEAGWNVLAQQVPMAPIDYLPGEEIGYNKDKWTSYERERRRLLSHLRDENIRNAVVLTGDVHANWANDLRADFDEPDSPSVATEFIGTSISSGGDGAASPPNLASLLSDNSFTKFHNNERGYVRCEVTPKQWRTDFRTVEYVSRPGAPIQTGASFVVEPGQPHLQIA